jgi:septum formation protein
MAAQLILASASPRRKQLLEGLGFTVKAVPSSVEEIRLDEESPVEFVKRISRDKVLAVARRTQAASLLEGTPPSVNAPKVGKDEPRWVIGADTVVVIDGVIFTKPTDNHHAYEMLSQLAGRPHEVITGFCIFDILKNKEGLQAVHTRVHFKPLSKREVEKYVAFGEGTDKAGGYAIQGVGAYMVERIEGSYTNVVGLPLCQVIEMMEEMGAKDILPF